MCNQALIISARGSLATSSEWISANTPRPLALEEKGRSGKSRDLVQNHRERTNYVFKCGAKWQWLHVTMPGRGKQ